MTIIVEDGSGVANANSYVDDAYFVAFALARGITIPATAELREQLLFKSMDYLESLRKKYKGCKTYSGQELQWPRENVYIDYMIFESNLIPSELKKAQCQAAIESISNALFETNDGSNVKKQKLDTLEVEYFENGSAGVPDFAAVNAYLSELVGQRSFKLVKV